MTSDTYIDGLVSVIMPMHNSASFLREAIDSVLAQTYTNWELLIVDDASTDNSLVLANEFAKTDNRIKVIRNEHSIGMPSAPRNVGIKLSKGRFIAFLDSDDIWFPQKLEQQLPLFEDRRVAIAYANYEKIDEYSNRKQRLVNAPDHSTYSSLLKGNVIGNLTGVYDRSKVGTEFIRNTHHEDYAMWLAILKKGFIAKNTGTVLGGYRITKNSISSQKLKTAGWQWTVYRDVERLSVLKSAYYFVFYAFKAFSKSLI